MRRGISLAELVVTIFLLSMLMTLAVNFLIPSLRAQARGAVQAGLQEQTTMALGRLTLYVQQSAGPGISLLNDNPPAPAETYLEGYPYSYPVVMAVIPIKKVLGDTSLDWDDRPKLLYFDRLAAQVKMAEWPKPGAPPTLSVTLTSASPARLPYGDLLALASPARLGTRSQLCRDVAFFDISHDMGRGTPIGSLLTFTLVLQGGQSQRYRLQRQVQLRN